MNDFGAVVFNPNVWVQFPHVIFSGLSTGAFFVIGISAYHLLRNKKEQEFFSASFRMASIFGVVAIFMVILIGHSQAQHMVQTQPMKMAAAEALLESADPASFSVFSIVDMSTNKDIFSLRIPGLLSLLSYNQFSGKVLGVNDLQAAYEKQYGPGNYIPPMIINYWSFRIMVGAGFLMMAIALYVLIQVMRKKTLAQPKLIALLPFAIALPYLANTSGWILTEVGRQPWIVFGLLKTQDAVSPILTPGLVLASLIGFTLLYGGLMVANVYLLKKFAKHGPVAVQPAHGKRAKTEEEFME